MYNGIVGWKMEHRCQHSELKFKTWRCLHTPQIWSVQALAGGFSLLLPVPASVRPQLLNSMHFTPNAHPTHCLRPASASCPLTEPPNKISIIVSCLCRSPAAHIPSKKGTSWASAKICGGRRRGQAWWFSACA